MSDDLIRVTMRLPVETRDEIYNMCDVVGIKPTFLMPVALLVGMRTLVQTLSLDQTVEMWKAVEATELETNQLLRALRKRSRSGC
jgi:hypothetical protein